MIPPTTYATVNAALQAVQVEGVEVLRANQDDEVREYRGPLNADGVVWPYWFTATQAAHDFVSVTLANGLAYELEAWLTTVRDEMGGRIRLVVAEGPELRTSLDEVDVACIWYMRARLEVV